MKRLALCFLLLAIGWTAQAVDLDEFGLLLDFAPPPDVLDMPSTWMTSIALYSDLRFDDSSKLRLSLGTPLGRWLLQLGFAYTFRSDGKTGWAGRLDVASIPDDQAAAELAVGGHIRWLDNEIWRIGVAIHPLLVRRHVAGGETEWNVFPSANAITDVSLTLAERVVIGQTFRIALADTRPCGEPLLGIPWKTGIVTHLSSSIGWHTKTTSSSR